ncbi:cob(I)yrinic acid a,c-diamide adenosyltransferase [Synechococcus sp. B60.1]|uniref:cob(I)yrinic acid a,c-diamide adenosyltransferase n=1 Tax=Synechococcus sp. B60.1 TaxID=2964522 RepID=UPI0039C20C1B
MSDLSAPAWGSHSTPEPEAVGVGNCGTESPAGTETDLNQWHRRRMQRRQRIQRQRLSGMRDDKGLIIVHTGQGKGKSTAAFGMIFRALGQGLSVGVVQFIKGAWDPGEAKLLRQLAAHPELGLGKIAFYAMGEGFTWETQDRERDIAHAQAAWAKGQELLSSGEYHLVLLDEINVALKLGYLSLEQVLAGLAEKPERVHVILTGRGAPAALIDRADLVTEMTLVKHPFRDQGIKAQIGIEF